jgi:N-formylglutamate deformylase
MILHIPHASDLIPEEMRRPFVLSNDDLKLELRRMTDAFTDELFEHPDTTSIRFPLSRLVVDVERFIDDSKEPMAKVGMGMIYTRTAFGTPLKRPLTSEQKAPLVELYKSHHLKLTNHVQEALAERGGALIVDCHSFPSTPLPCDTNQDTPRPDFCIGTDSFHTPVSYTQAAEQYLQGLGYTVGINQPYAGALVPMKYYQKDPQVAAVMIEVNRRLYMDETTGIKTSSFDAIRSEVQELLAVLRKR